MKGPSKEDEEKLEGLFDLCEREDISREIELSKAIFEQMAEFRESMAEKNTVVDTLINITTDETGIPPTLKEVGVLLDLVEWST